jgi:signal transduction histidine kinase
VVHVHCAQRASRRHLHGLVMHAQEEERRRIADGIHDDSLQSVVAVGLRLGAIRRRVGDPPVIEALELPVDAERPSGDRGEPPGVVIRSGGEK